MPEIHEPARAAWTRYAETLIKYDGVISVGPGRRMRGGKETSEDVLVVTVVMKKGLDNLKPEQVIPQQVPLDDGHTVGVDIVEDPAGYPTIDQDSAAYRPVPGGCEVGAIGSGFLGTLGGWFCSPRPGGGWNPVWLTNAHVADPATRRQVPADSRMQQPAGGGVIGNTTAVDGWPTPLPAAGVTVTGINDAAVGQLVDGVDPDYEVLQIADAPFEIATATNNMAVQKRGRTTFLTAGTVQTANIAVNVSAGVGLGLVTFGLPGNPAVTRITSNAAGLAAAFGAPGDSGSLVFATNPGRLASTFPCVGLYFAGTFAWVSRQPNANALTVTGLMFDIQAVMNRLNLEPVCNCVLRSLLDAIFGRNDSTSDSAASVKRSDAMLRRFRDGTLARTSRGKKIAESISETTPTVARLLAQDPKAFELTVQLLEPWVDARSSAQLLVRKLDDETVKHAHALADHVATKCPELADRILPLVETIDKYQGQSIVRMIGQVPKAKLRKRTPKKNPKHGAS